MKVMYRRQSRAVDVLRLRSIIECRISEAKPAVWGQALGPVYICFILWQRQPLDRPTQFWDHAGGNYISLGLALY